MSTYTSRWFREKNLVPSLVSLLTLAGFGIQLASAHVCGPGIIKLRIDETRTYTIGSDNIRTLYQVTDPGTNQNVATINPSGYLDTTDGVFEIMGHKPGTTTITIYWDSEIYEEEFAKGECVVKVRVAPPFINSTGDAGDIIPGDGMCDTDGLIDRAGEEEIECTLRAAIQESNAIAGPDAYPYDIPTTDTGHEGGGNFRIQPGGSLPPINDELFLDGTTAFGKSGEASQIPVTSITVDGSGFVLGGGASGSILSGHIIINSPGPGIQIDANTTTVINSIIGTNAAGSAEDGNGGPGILVNGNENNIGGASAADQNIISGNAGYGIEVHGSENKIYGNWVGVSPNGTTAIANTMGGIALLEGTANEIGGETATAGVAPGNVISGNGPAETSGIIIQSNENVIKGNLIGLDSSGENPLGNGAQGIEVTDANDNVIGDLTGDSGNRIAHNRRDGVRITGESTGNAIVRNEIFENQELGIDLGGTGISLNDDGDGDEGPNQLQNFPTLTYRTSKDGQTQIDGFLSSTPSTVFRLEFFANDDADNSGFGEADEFLDHREVTTNAAGLGEFSFQFEGIHDRVVATATDPDNNTSELSKAAIMVNNIADTGDSDGSDGACNSGGMVGAQKACSLRAAIQEANNLLGPDFVGFDIPGNGPFFIHVSSALPVISEEVTIDGTVQNGYTPEFGAVEVTGQNIGASGLKIVSDKVNIRGITIRDFDGEGIEFTGNGTLTLSYVQLKNNSQNGLYATSDVVIEDREDSNAATLEAIANGRNGILLQEGAKLSAKGLVKANLNGSAFTRPLCSRVAGIFVVGSIEIEDVEADNNCGDGLHVELNISQGGSVKITGGVKLTKNFGIGLVADGPIDIMGGFVQVEDNDAEGMRTIESIKIAGSVGAKSVEGEDILLKNNGLEALNAVGNVTLTGTSVVEGNGFKKPENYPCFDNRYGAIVSQDGSVTTDAITVKGNCGSGIIAGSNITINGNATINDNTGNFGIWGGGSITLVGDAHEVSRNGEAAIWSADGGRLPKDGIISVTGSLTAHGNGKVTSIKTCRLTKDTGSDAAIATEGFIELQSVDISDNCESGIFSFKSITIAGNARIRGNTGSGIISGNPGLTITGSSHDISNNGLDGVVMRERTGGRNDGIVSGHLQIRNNNTFNREENNDRCDPDRGLAGFWAKHSRVVVDRLTTINNCGDGIFSRDLTVNGVVKANSNSGHGIFAINRLNLNTGQVCTNDGWGILAGIIKMGSVQVCDNELGGIRGTIVASKSGAVSNLISDVSVIDGASVENNFGSGISVDRTLMTVVNSNISGNSGFGISSTTGIPAVVAEGNWWGAASGPSGTGGGSGDGVSEGVEIDPWLTNPVGLVASSATDTLFVLPGTTASVSFSFRNWINENDALSVSFANADGWLQNPGTFPVQLSDTLVTVISREVIVPPGKQASMSYIYVDAVSTLDNTQSASDSMLVLTYQPALTSIVIAPDTLSLSQFDTQTFRAFATDQAGLPFAVTIAWSAAGGNIDQMGVFTAGDESGFFAIVARDPLSGISGTAIAHVVAPVGTGELNSFPSEFALQTAYPNPFVGSTTIPFQTSESVRVRLTVYNILGQRVRTLVDQVLPAGRHQIVMERDKLTTGMYIVFLEAGEFRSSRTLTLIN